MVLVCVGIGFEPHPLEFVTAKAVPNHESCKEKRTNMNLKSLVYRLQTALLNKGCKVKINQYQSYSDKSKRMITKYVITVPKQEGDRIKNVKVLETYQLSEVVKKLAEMYGGETG